MRSSPSVLIWGEACCETLEEMIKIYRGYISHNIFLLFLQQEQDDTTFMNMLVKKIEELHTLLSFMMDRLQQEQDILDLYCNPTFVIQAMQYLDRSLLEISYKKISRTTLIRLQNIHHELESWVKEWQQSLEKTKELSSR